MIDLTKRDCHDCAAKPGELHDSGCDTERCPECGMQLIGCGCYGEVEEFDGEKITPPCGEWPDDSIRDRWTGIWPGTEECIEFGWYSKFTSRGWVTCNKDDPEAGPDLNRLVRFARWDKIKKRFVKAEVKVAQ